MVLHCLLIQLFFSTILTHISTLNTNYIQSINHKVLHYVIFSAVLLTYLSETKYWHTQSQKMVIILNVYTVHIPQLLH